MTGLRPARELHTALFNISTDTLHQIAMVICLLAVSAVVIVYFSAYIFPVVLAAMAITMVVEFFSDMHKRNTWKDDE